MLQQNCFLEKKSPTKNNDFQHEMTIRIVVTVVTESSIIMLKSDNFKKQAWDCFTANAC